MKVKRTEQNERGQVLVLLALVIIGILGFAALAVDGGMIYSQRRQAQNATDAAAMAAALAYGTGTGGTYRQAALKSLALNGYDMDTDADTNPSKPVDVQVYNPPISGRYASVPDNLDYFQVIIRQQFSPIFAQFVFRGKLESTVETVVHYTESQGISGKNALMTLAPHRCPGLVINGGSETTIFGGNIFSNSDYGNMNGNCASGVAKGTTGFMIAEEGTINMVGSWIQNAGFLALPSPTTGNEQLNPPDRRAPKCDLSNEHKNYNQNLLPGYYPNGIKLSGNTDVTMASGLYCVEGDFSINNKSLTGNGVVIYMMPNGGGVSITGTPFVTLTTKIPLWDGVRDVGGYLFFMDPANHNGIDIAGSSGSHYQGTIYAPSYRNPESQEKCNLGGTGTTTSFNSNIVCWSVGVAGNAILSIDYKPEENHQEPMKLEITQ